MTSAIPVTVLVESNGPLLAVGIPLSTTLCLSAAMLSYMESNVSIPCNATEKGTSIVLRMRAESVR